MSEAHYRKILIAHHFFKKIQHLTATDPFSHRDLMSTVASYFDFGTGCTETQSQAAASMIQRAFFRVEKLKGVGCTDNINKLVIVELEAPPPGVTYVLFWSIVNGSAIDKRAPDCSIFVEFALYFSKTLVSSLPDIVLPFITTDTVTPITSTQADTDIKVLAQEVGNYTDNYIDNMTIEDLRALVRITGSVLGN